MEFLFLKCKLHTVIFCATFSFLKLKYKLHDIARIRPGIYAQPELHADTLYLQVGHFDTNGKLQPNTKPEVSQNNFLKYILEDKEILFVAKGTKFSSFLYRESMGRAVPSSIFLSIRIFPEFLDKISSEYLLWFLHQKTAQRYFAFEARGTSTQQIPVSVLAQLNVTIPPLRQQYTLLQIDNLRRREKMLSEKINILKNKVLDRQLLKIITE